MPTDRWLFLLRHAKSDWEDGRTTDHERPLAPRGRKAVQTMAAHMRAHSIEPELILCSSARRTRETLAGLGAEGQTLVEPELYSAGPAFILERLREIGAGAGSVMVVGHNPALQALALRLAGPVDRSVEDSPRAQLERKFPTCGLASLRFEGSWAELAPGSAELVDFARPHALSVLCQG